MGRHFIKPEEAISLLKDGEEIHTFRNPGAGMMVGCDWSREKIIETLEKNPDKIEIGGKVCRAMGHGLIVDDSGFLYIEIDEEKLNEFDPIENTKTK